MKGEGVENRCRCSAEVWSALRADRDGWRKVRLGDAIVNFDRVRIPLSSLERERRHGVYPYYGANGVIDHVDSYLFDGEYILLAEDGNTVVDENGFPTLHRASGKFWVNNHAHVFKSADDVDQDYLFYSLKATNFRATVTGAAQPKINQENMNNVLINLPPLPIQHRIAEILGAYDDLIENNRRRIALLEKMARELYRERFVRRAGAAHAMRTLEDIGIRLESGSRPKGGIKEIAEGIPSVGAENVIGLGQYNYCSEKLISREFFAKMKRGVIRDRDILLYKDGAYIGRVSLFQDGFPHKEAAINEHVFLIHTNDETLQYYIFFTLAQERYFKIIQGLNENAAQPGLNQGSVLGLKIEWPEEEDIKAFDRLVAPFVSEIFSLALQNRNLALQRDRLLPRLLSGKLDVSKLFKEGALP